MTITTLIARNSSRGAARRVNVNTVRTLLPSATQCRTFKDDPENIGLTSDRERTAEERFHMLNDLKLMRKLVEGLQKTHTEIERGHGKTEVRCSLIIVIIIIPRIPYCVY